MPDDIQEAISELIAERSTPEPEATPSPVAPAAPAEPASFPGDSGDAGGEPEDPEKQAEERRNAYLREIAMDPGLSLQYAQNPQQFQQPQPQYQQPAYQQPPAPQQPQVPWSDPSDYDPTNPDHQKALLAAQLQEYGNPLFEKVERMEQRFAQEEAQKQAQQLQEVHNAVNQRTVNFLDTYVPGFAGIAEKVGKGEGLSPIEKAVFNEAVNAESAYLQTLHPHAAMDVKVRTQIAQQIGPQLKEYAKALGLVSQPKQVAITPQMKQDMKRESYVESANAVPAVTAGAFDKALESGDEFQMIRALRAT